MVAFVLSVESAQDPLCAWAELYRTADQLHRRSFDGCGVQSVDAAQRNEIQAERSFLFTVNISSLKQIFTLPSRCNHLSKVASTTPHSEKVFVLGHCNTRASTKTGRKYGLDRVDCYTSRVRARIRIRSGTWTRRIASASAWYTRDEARQGTITPDRRTPILSLRAEATGTTTAARITQRTS